MKLEEIVMRLVGQIRPIGSTNEDADRLENLDNLTKLIDNLLLDIHRISLNSDSQQDSVKVAGQHAEKFLNGLADWVKEI